MTGSSISAQSFNYSVFGLSIRSSIPLPELFEAPAQGTADVTVRLGDVPAANGGAAGLHVNGDGLLLVVPQVARFRISGGDTVVVQPEPGVPDRNVRLYLLGSAFGAVLHQRGLLPLHANAVEIEGRAVAFMGPSGEGKSTLAAWFHDKGYRVIADDVCVIGFDADGQAFAAPGLPRLRLWAEALQLMGRGSEGLARSYAGDDQYDKFDVPIDPDSAAMSHTPLAALYLLDRGTELAIAELRGLQAAEAVFANTYRGGYVSLINGHKEHWESAVRLVRGTSVFRAARKWGLMNVEEQCSLLLEHVQALPPWPRAREGFCA